MLTLVSMVFSGCSHGHAGEPPAPAGSECPIALALVSQLGGTVRVKPYFTGRTTAVKPCLPWFARLVLLFVAAGILLRRYFSETQCVYCL